MCCLFTTLLFLGPRAGILVWGLLQPLRWEAAFNTFIWPFLGQIFLTMEILIGFGYYLVAVLCLVRGIERTRFRIPFLADLADRF